MITPRDLSEERKAAFEEALAAFEDAQVAFARLSAEVANAIQESREQLPQLLAAEEAARARLFVARVRLSRRENPSK